MPGIEATSSSGFGSKPVLIESGSHKLISTDRRQCPADFQTERVTAAGCWSDQLAVARIRLTWPLRQSRCRVARDS